MAIPTLTPVSQVSAVVLPRTGLASDVALQTPIGVYDNTTEVLEYHLDGLGGVIDISFSKKINRIGHKKNSPSKRIFAELN